MDEPTHEQDGSGNVGVLDPTQATTAAQTPFTLPFTPPRPRSVVAPDLLVAWATITSSEGTQEAKALVKNIGELPMTTSVQWTLRGINAGTLTTYTTPILCWNASSSLTLTQPLGILQADVYKLTVTVDPAGLVPEANEVNNVYLKDYTQQRALTGPPHAFVFTTDLQDPGKVLIAEEPTVFFDEGRSLHFVVQGTTPGIYVSVPWLHSLHHAMGSGMRFSVTNLVTSQVTNLPPEAPRIDGAYAYIPLEGMPFGDTIIFQPIDLGYSTLYTLGDTSQVALTERAMQITYTELPGDKYRLDQDVAILTTERGDRMVIDFLDPYSTDGQEVRFNKEWLKNLGLNTPTFTHEAQLNEPGLPFTSDETAFRVQVDHFSPVYVWKSYRSDDNTYETTFLFDYADDYAIKRFDVPAEVTSTATSAKLWVWANAENCPGGTLGTHRFYVNNVIQPAFDPCAWSSATSAAWRGFTVPVSTLTAGINRFEFRDVGSSWGSRDIRFYIDTSSGNDNTDARYTSSGSDYEVNGELIWQLDVYYARDAPTLRLTPTITQTSPGGSRQSTFTLDLSGSVSKVSPATLTYYWDFDDNGVYEQSSTTSSTATNTGSPSPVYNDWNIHCVRYRIKDSANVYTGARQCMIKEFWNTALTADHILVQKYKSTTTPLVEVYFDPTITTSDADWSIGYLERVVKYATTTYGSLVQKNVMFAHEANGVSPFAVNFRDTTFGLGYNWIDVSIQNWAPTDYWCTGFWWWSHCDDTAKEVLLHEVGHWVEGVIPGHKTSPAYDHVWGDSMWAQFFIYDGHRNLAGGDEDASRVYDLYYSDQTAGATQPDEDGNSGNNWWFKHWWIPIRDRYGGSATMKKYFQLAGANWPTDSNDYYTSANGMRFGDYVFFMSAAAGKNLKGQAWWAFADDTVPSAWETEFSNSRTNYPALAAMFPDCEISTSNVKVRAYRHAGSGGVNSGPCMAYQADQDNIQDYFTDGTTVRNSISALTVKAGYVAVLYYDNGFVCPCYTARGTVTTLPSWINDDSVGIRVFTACGTSTPVELYEDASYAGGCKSASAGSMSNFAGITFDNGVDMNDKVSSVNVASGYNLVLYPDANFLGTSTLYSTTTASLGSMNDLASSYKVLPKCVPTARVVLYQDNSYVGGCKSYTSTVNDFWGVDFDNGVALNDMTSSIKVASGYNAVLYEHANYGGASQVYAGSSTYVGSGMNDKASSMKVLAQCSTSAKVRVYLHSGYTGGCLSFNANDDYFPDNEFDSGVNANDAVSSIIIKAGCGAILYSDAWYGGSSATYAAGSYSSMPSGWNDVISSIKITGSC